MLWEDNYIAHFGIKGQKWGVRRYQNPDGSLTPAGEEHYYGKIYNKEKKRQRRLDKNADLRKQAMLADEHKRKAEKSLAIGTTAAVAAGAGYGISKMLGPGSMTTERVTVRSAGQPAHTYTSASPQSKIGTGALIGMVIGAPVAAVALPKAGYHGIRSAIAGHRASPSGHDKALNKAKRHYQDMLTIFEGTKYEDLVKNEFGDKTRK